MIFLHWIQAGIGIGIGIGIVVGLMCLIDRIYSAIKTELKIWKM